jgi:hypothetical protein
METMKVESEAVDGFHAECRMFAGMIGVLDPADEFVIKPFEVADVAEVANEKLVSDGSKESFDLALGGTIPHRGVNHDGAETGANHAELLGRIIGAIVHIDSFGHAALVDGCLEAVDKIGGVVGGVERPMRNNAGSIVNEADQEGLQRRLSPAVEVRTIECVALPQVVGMRFGEGQSCLGAVMVGRSEQVEPVDNPAESGAPDP